MNAPKKKKRPKHPAEQSGVLDVSVQTVYSFGAETHYACFGYVSRHWQFGNPIISGRGNTVNKLFVRQLSNRNFIESESG